MKSLHNNGFGAVGVLIVLLIIGAIAGVGSAVYRNNHPQKNDTKSKASISTSKTPSQTQPKDPYQGWKTYKDDGYTEASGINIKYPADWQVNVGNSNAYAWSLASRVSPSTSIYAKSISLNSSLTAQQEWDNCPSVDACGPAEGDTKISEDTFSINGLDGYMVVMKNETGIYHATVIKKDKASNGLSTFVELLLYDDNASMLKTYYQIVDSASFPVQ